MKIGPKMAFILRVYQMTDAENAEDVERDREMVAAGLMSQREYDKRMPTRDVARKSASVTTPRYTEDRRSHSCWRRFVGRQNQALKGRAAIMIPKRANFTLEVRNCFAPIHAIQKTSIT